MKTKLHLLLLTTFITLTGFSQSSEKIKGNRNVTTQITEILNFNRLLIGDDFKLKIKYGDQAAVHIDTDDNLHEVINFAVDDTGTLSFKTNKRITSSKTMDITVIYKDSLKIIELKEDAEITATVDLKLKDFILKTKESAKAYMTLEADHFTYITAGKSESELNVTANTITLEMSDNSDLEALFNASTINMNLLQRSDAKIEGDVDDLIIKADNNITLKADKLEAKNCNLLTEGRSEIYLQATKNLTIEASVIQKRTYMGTRK
ncbi:DUF2807 domain-containing protein [Lacinutrix neustonica]|uniref:DUF2807 domain-containing protein n=1 Tax=Lacinutrix neustonica TaxID=2980107 RepID=A0A9E8MX97_9FLAO|nr:DUF2807 domain-containing protein [Lacinutrix neustonica]WAC03248.1 DUF2807 domain-containing protein [Lacinutrix neustonica]